MNLSNYDRSQKRKLIETVQQLASSLDRPVCSNDLKKYYAKHPSARPLLTQRFGQLLIKAARPSKSAVPRLFPCGIWNYHQYYAPDSNPVWLDKFNIFLAGQRLKKEASIQFLDRTRYLLGGPYDSELRNALAGWIQEFNPLVEASPNDSDAKLLRTQLDIARAIASPQYFLDNNLNLISRSQAIQVLSESLLIRCTHRAEFKVNYNRYLADLSWPQSSLYPSGSTLLYRSEHSLRPLNTFGHMERIILKKPSLLDGCSVIELS